MRRRIAKRGLGKTGNLQFPGFHPHLRPHPSGHIPAQAENPAGPREGQAKEIKAELRRRMHLPVPEQGTGWGRWSRLLRLPRRAHQLSVLGRIPASRHRLWLRTLRRRSQKDRTTLEAGWRGWPKTSFQDRKSFIPGLCALCRQTPEVGAGCLNWARRICAGDAQQ